MRKKMNLHIELDTSHPAYEWLERQADKIGAKGHFGTHGQHHIERDKMCEAAGCYVIENIRIAPGEIDEIQTIRVNFDLAYPSTGKLVRLFLGVDGRQFRYRLSGNQKIEIAQNLIDIMEKRLGDNRADHYVY